jgi:hypothetical protein
VFVAFYAWDVLAIERGHWWFAPRTTTGVVLPLGVPLEEAVFFVVIPTCGLLTLEAVRNLLDRRIPPWPLSRRRGDASDDPDRGDHDRSDAVRFEEVG